jgi:hypothetical protein
MFHYTHYRQTDVVQYLHADVPVCHPGDLTPYGTKHQHTDGPQHIPVDVHSEDSAIKTIFFVKITSTKFHKNLPVGNLVTPHGKRNESISPF